MGSPAFPALVGVLCAGALALEGIALVWWARDQHAVRSRLSRGVALCASAVALILAGALARRLGMTTAAMDRTGGLPVANSTLLLGAWALAALTLSEVSRGALLLAGGPFPLDLRHAVVGGVPAERRKRVIGWLRDPAILRAGCLTVLVVALSVVALGIPPQPGGAPAAGDARVAAAVVLATDVVVAAFACAQRTLHTRRALTLLTFGTAFTCVALVSLVIGP